MIVPNFLGIGAQRSGTTWLDAMLRRHPQAWLPTRRKEIHYFDRYYDRGPAWYREFFPAAEIGVGHRAVGEITPNYLYAREAPARIAADHPDVRLIAILRNPVDRAYSQFGLEIVKGRHSGGDFRAFLERMPDAIGRGLYHEQIERYLARFPREQLLVLVFEEAMADPARALAKIHAFLGLDPVAASQQALRDKVGESRRPRFAAARRLATQMGRRLRDRDIDWLINAAKAVGVERLFGDRGALPPLEAGIRQELVGRFEADIRQLEALLGRDLSSWRQPGARA